MKRYLIILFAIFLLSACKTSKHVTQDVVLQKQDSTVVLANRVAKVDITKLDRSQIQIIEIELNNDTSSARFVSVSNIPVQSIKSIKTTIIKNDIKEDVSQVDTTKTEEKTISTTEEKTSYEEKTTVKAGYSFVYIIVVVVAILFVVVYIVIKRYLKI